MEAKLGPLQSVIDQAGVRMAKGEAMKEKDESLAASLQVLERTLSYTQDVALAESLYCAAGRIGIRTSFSEHKPDALACHFFHHSGIGNTLHACHSVNEGRCIKCNRETWTRKT